MNGYGLKNNFMIFYDHKHSFVLFHIAHIPKIKSIRVFPNFPWQTKLVWLPRWLTFKRRRLRLNIKPYSLIGLEYITFDY